MASFASVPKPVSPSRCPSIPVVPPEPTTITGSSQWQASLTRVVPAIVVIRVCSCSAFDGESPGYSHATGFVVDKARGIILTNRHVVTPGRSALERARVEREQICGLIVFTGNKYNMFPSDLASLFCLTVNEHFLEVQTCGCTHAQSNG